MANHRDHCTRPGPRGPARDRPVVRRRPAGAGVPRRRRPGQRCGMGRHPAPSTAVRLRRGAGSPVLLAVLAGVLLTTGTDAAAVADARAASAAVRPTSASAVEPALDPTALGTGAPAARLAARACPTPLATTPGVRVRCATLTVPLDRAHPALGTAKLLVTRVLPPGRPAAEPVIHLAGGPGGSAESYLPVLPTVFAELAARTGREVVILDQRGTGRSRPLLTCGDAPVDAACAAASARRGAPVTAFGVDANADDVADLVRALGARRAHVWGQSFGSGLAIVLAHRHPGVLASLTLEAVDRPASATASPRCAPWTPHAHGSGPACTGPAGTCTTGRSRRRRPSPPVRSRPPPAPSTATASSWPSRPCSKSPGGPARPRTSSAPRPGATPSSPGSSSCSPRDSHCPAAPSARS